MRRFVIIILALALVQLTPLTGFGSQPPHSLPVLSGSLLNAVLYVPKDITAIKDQLSTLYLQTVKNGKVGYTILNVKDLQPASEMAVDGYVTGLVVRGSQHLDIHVDGKRMDKIRTNEDGTVSIRNFGNSSLDSVGISDALNRYHPADGTREPYSQDEKEVAAGFYSFFPAIVGETICAAPKVDIDFAIDGENVKMALMNPGYVYLESHKTADKQRKPIIFRYLGSRLQGLEGRPADFQDRINAITAGISNAEKQLGMKLVDNVNIIDYEPIHDAVTLQRQHDIWFYISTFEKESLAELKSMGEHESIHIYVDSKNLTRNSDIRKLYADLKGYSPLSMERFTLVTSGRVLRQPTVESTPENPFFAFIDERNFQKGRLGGHSHSDLDEFCTSFIHSLMFADRLEGNLNSPIVLPGRSHETRQLTAEEKKKIRTTYLHFLSIVDKAVASEDRQDPTAEPGQSLFQQALYRLQNQNAS